MLKCKRGLALLLAVCMVMGFVLTGGPAAANAEDYDPYVYVFGPDLDTIPEYYQDYAKEFAGWTPHLVMPRPEIVFLFNLVKVDDIIEDEDSVPEALRGTPYATVYALCGDLLTDFDDGTRYRRIELEDAHFNTGNDTSNAEHIRALVENSMPYLKNPEVVQEAANAYLAEIGASSVVNLTSSELATAIQSAIWSFSDAADLAYYGVSVNSNPYYGTTDYEDYGSLYTGQFYRITSLTDPLDIYEDSNYSSNDIYGVYRYLRALDPVKSKEVLISDNSISLKKAVVIGSGDNYTLTLTIGINGTIDGDDDLVLTAKCGDQTKTFRLGATTTADKVGDGLYAITFTGVSAADCEAVELTLSGSQTVTGAYYFEAEPTGSLSAKNASQGMVGYVSDSVSVLSARTVNALANTVTTEITKLDKRSGNPLSGVSFDLYMKQTGGDVLVGTFTTDKNGKISVMVTDPDAEYYFVESQALAGYQSLEDSVASGEVTNDWSDGSLSISKELINTTPATADETFGFDVTLDLSTAKVAENGLSWMDGDYFKDQLECSESLSWTVDGQKLTARVTVNAGESVTIDGIPLGTTFTVAEVLDKDQEALYSVTATINGETSAVPAQGEIAEKNAVVFTNSVVTADVKLGELSISKELINTTPATADETFEFTVTLNLGTAEAYQNPVPWMNDNYLMNFITSSEALAWEGGNKVYTAKVIVNAGETVTISGIAQGTTFTVAEVLDKDQEALYSVTATINGETSDVPAQGEIAENNAVVFTNSVVTADVKLGELSISKELINTTPAEVGETFNFKITIDLSTADVYEQEVPWLDDAYLMTLITSSEELTWSAEDGKYTAEFTVDADETVTISGLAQGTTYTVEEILTEDERKLFNVTTTIGETETEGNTVDSTIAEENAILFTNSVVTADVKLGELSISKELINTTPAEVGETFNFKITIDLSTADVYEQEVPWLDDAYLMTLITSSEELAWTAEDGKYTAEFTVDAGETVTIGGIAQGTTFTVEEIQTEEDREWFIVTTQIGEEDAVNGTIAEGSVAEKNTVLFTNEVVQTDGPETDGPETDGSETDSPETDVPETDSPETDGSETDSPETDGSETDSPETDGSETDSPETDVPETSAPETDVPETSAPETDVPETDGPKTGDAGVGFPLMLCFLTMLGAAILLLNRRRFI